MRVLFMGLLSQAWASGRQRLRALEAAGHEVSAMQIDGADNQHRIEGRLRRRLLGRDYRASDVAAFGARFADAVARIKPDVVWAEKLLMLRPEWIAEARRLSPRTFFAAFQDDDPFGMRTWELPLWTHFIDCIPAYDVHFVKKDVDLAEFKMHGAKRVTKFIHGVFEPIFHPRCSVPEWAKRELVFVGTPLDHRVRFVTELIARKRVPLHVYGNNWQRKPVRWLYRDHFHPAVVSEDYATLLSGSKISLGFVSSSNRDEYTMRTFEIPGSGSMLLAERTSTHQALFDEGREAEFFSSAEECADKATYYLRNEAQRERVAHAGAERCVTSGYSLTRRMRDAFDDIQKMRAQS